MNIQITPAAEEKLSKYVNQNALLLFDLDDGVGDFSKFGVCSLDTSFRILVVEQDSNLKDYPTVLESSVGPLHIKDYTENYFTENPVLDLNPRFQNLVFKSETGTIDGNVEIIDMRAMQAMAKEEQ